METKVDQTDWLGRYHELNPKELPSLVLAQIGDAVYELFIRSRLAVEKRGSAHKFHLATVKYVKAGAQAKALLQLWDELSEEEQAIAKRGRNAKAGHVPKNADPADYAKSSAFEALLGYLYLDNNDLRLKELMEKTKAIIEEN